MAPTPEATIPAAASPAAVTAPPAPDPAPEPTEPDPAPDTAGDVAAEVLARLALAQARNMEAAQVAPPPEPMPSAHPKDRQALIDRIAREIEDGGGNYYFSWTNPDAPRLSKDQMAFYNTNNDPTGK